MASLIGLNIRAFAHNMPYAICQPILPFKHKNSPPSRLVKVNYCKIKIAIMLLCNYKGRTALQHCCKTKNIISFFFSLCSVSLTLPLSQVCLPRLSFFHRFLPFPFPLLSLNDFSFSLCSPSSHRWPPYCQATPSPGRVSPSNTQAQAALGHYLTRRGLMCLSWRDVV